MAISDATYPWAARFTSGTLHYKNLYSNTFGYTETQKKVSAGSTTAVLAATTIAQAGQTITSGITQPDVPRTLVVTIGGTAASVQSCTIVVNGTNVEGKPIFENFVTTIATTGAINGVKAFKSVTSVIVPAQAGTGVTVAVGTLNVLGINHRLFKNNTTVKVYSSTAVAHGPTALTLQGAPTVNAHDTLITQNTVQPATTPDGTTFLIIAYSYDNWSDGTTFQDQPEFSTTTSTSSTSSSTSTTTITTSTSSTSSSTSSTSTSSTSSSTSTSSTSTSTTTLP